MKEFAFDVTLTAVVRVTANTLDEAQLKLAAIDTLDGRDVALQPDSNAIDLRPNGESAKATNMRITEFSLANPANCLFPFETKEVES